MNVGAHYESLTRELEALKDRVRNFDNTRGWLADGEWKESVLRSILRRYLPAGVEPLRGYVVTGKNSSKQIDVLLYDSRVPVLFRDGDLVFITPDAVRGIIEVKTRIDTRKQLAQALTALAENASLVRSRCADRQIFVGLFTYDSKFSGTVAASSVLEEMCKAASGKHDRIVNYACLGCSLFSSYWQLDPHDNETDHEAWHAYWLKNHAAGYFIVNLIKTVAAESVVRNKDMWYPPEGQEKHKLAEFRFITEINA
jgi:hypothetical protein